MFSVSHLPGLAVQTKNVPVLQSQRSCWKPVLVRDPEQTETDRNRQDPDQAGAETGGRIQTSRHPQAPRRVPSQTGTRSVTRWSRTGADRIRCRWAGSVEEGSRDRTWNQNLMQDL